MLFPMGSRDRWLARLQTNMKDDESQVPDASSRAPSMGLEVAGNGSASRDCERWHQQGLLIEPPGEWNHPVHASMRLTKPCTIAASVTPATSEANCMQPRPLFFFAAVGQVSSSWERSRLLFGAYRAAEAIYQY